MKSDLEPKRLPGARKAAMPDFISPQLATLVKEAPTGDHWFHELKFDGYRFLCHINRRKVRFWTRNQKDWTDKFPNLLRAVQSIPATTAILDGEVIVLDPKHLSSFQKLQQALGKGDDKLIYEVFDLIYLDGFDLTRCALKDRKSLLAKLFASTGARGPVRYSDHIEGNGSAFFRKACDHGIEGIVSKLASAPYESSRNRNWLKVKCGQRQEFVIAGYTPSEKGLAFASLILGVYEKGELVYSGRVGTGFSDRFRAELRKKLDKISRPTSPFATTPRESGLREAHWVTPKLVAEVAFTEWTSDGSIRHPSFQGLREDKKPEEIRRESPA
ncbi:MAG TPA: non-homologous end-joining DNA ligase [Blastocatellia bacterium]|nr:non-homologous end-joining DNA ligase [Blastocatellia bacterium]